MLVVISIKVLVRINFNVELGVKLDIGLLIVLIKCVRTRPLRLLSLEGVVADLLLICCQIHLLLRRRHVNVLILNHF